MSANEPTPTSVLDVPPGASRARSTPGDRGSVAQRDSEGWVTARPPRALEVVQRIAGFPGLLNRHWDLAWTSVKRELEARFQGTLLGWFWPLLQPLFLFVVYYFIFSRLLDMKFKDLPPGQEAAMAVFMFVGIIVWASIAETLNRGTNVIVDNGNLIKKLAFPSELLPFNLTVVGLVTQAFAVAIFVGACLVTPLWTAPGIGVLWIPLLLLVQGVFTYGLTLFLSTLQVFLRDTLQVVAVVTTVWMFATPIFWTPQIMSPESAVADYLSLIHANPVFHLVQAWRGALIGHLELPAVRDYPGGAVVVDPSAVLGHIGVFAIWAVAAYAIGFAFFVLCQRRFADEV